MPKRNAKKSTSTPYSALVERAGDAFIVHSIVEGIPRIVDVNTRACEMLGYTRDELIGKTIPEISADFRPPHASELWGKVGAGEPAIFDTHLRRQDGVVLPAEISLSALKLPDRTYYLGILRDMSQRIERDQVYRHLVESMNDAALVMDPEGRLVEVNRKAEQLLGYSRTELLTMTPSDMGADLSTEKMRTVIADVLSGHPRVEEVMHRTADGRLIPVESSLSATSYLGQEAVISLVRDITHRKEVEESLLRLSQRTQAILQTIPDIIAEVDQNKVYTWANEAALDFFGSDMIGREAAEYFVGPQSTYASVEPMFSGASDYEYLQSWQRRRDGENRLLAWWCRTLRDPDGQVTGALSTARDITELRHEQAMRDSRLRILESAPNDTVEDFLQNVLRELEILTSSPIGFCNFMTNDGEVFTAAAWATLEDTQVCKVEPQNLHHVVSEAGVWADCARQRRPVVYNDFSSVSGRKGTPPGHAELTRILSVPVFRSDKIVGVFVLGNKQSDYADLDVETVDTFVDLAWYTVARKQAEAALRESDTRNRRLFDSSPHAVLLSDIGGHFLDCNQTAVDTYGYSREEFLKLTYRDLAAPSLRARAGEHMDETLALGGTVFEWRHVRKDGSELPVEIKTAPFTAQGRQRIIATVRDLTESKAAQAEQERLHEQLRQAAKMESIGRLAGGVAHDFNNMLAVILGHTELALERGDENDPLQADLLEIRTAAEHSASITQQLLAFARRQVAEPKVIDLNTTVEGTLAMLGRLIGERVTLTWHPDENVCRIAIDPAQLDQILVNVCLNSRDAIKGSGQVKITTARAMLDEKHCKTHNACSPGEYVILSIEDNGVGMTAEAVDHMFEPFFTTKDVGEGTGLGLATVYGIVHQNSGYIDVVSSRDHGTKVDIAFPSVDAPLSDTTPKASARDATVGGSETLLVIEDEPSVLRLAGKILQNLGYQVLAAATPNQALSLAREHSEKIALAITDVVMPEMSGWDLSEQLRGLLPTVKTLFVSGYTNDILAEDDHFSREIDFLHKPFTPQQLAEAVRTAIDRGCENH